MAKKTKTGSRSTGQGNSLRASGRLARLRIHKLIRLLADRSYWPALREGVAASVEHSSVPFRDDIRTVLDIGASRGQFALFAVRRFPEARVVCFEPLPEPLAELTKVLGARVETHETAVGARSGTAEINLSARDDSSSLLPIGERQSKEFPGTAAAGSLSVGVTTLDEAMAGPPARPCLLKVDVQGLELEVLLGAEETLESVDEALIECSFVELYEGQPLADEIVAHMFARGLRLIGVHGIAKSSDGHSIQADFHFRRTAE